MSSTIERGEETRRLAKDRLRSGFLGQAVRQLREMSALLGQASDSAVRDTIAHELDRMAAAAETFGLDAIREGARESAMAIMTGGGTRALRPVADAVRVAGGRSRFPPIAIVAQDPLVGRLRIEAGRCCEQVLFFASIDAWRDDLQVEEPQALVLPSSQLGSLQPDDHRAPIYVYGPVDDLDGRLAAADAGVAGWLPERLEFRTLLDRVRVHAYQVRAPAPRLVVVSDDADRREALRHALDRHGSNARAAASAAEVLGLLEDTWPEGLVVDATVGGVGADRIAQVSRGHHRHVDMVLAVLATADEALRYLEAGADVVIDPSLSADDIARRVRVAQTRARERSIGRDPATGLRDRVGMLRAVDRALSEARRGGRTLATAVVELDQLPDVMRTHGRSATDQALRVLARCIESAVRANDLIGRLGGDAFLVLFPGCNAEQARRRLNDIRNLFAALCARDDRLEGLSFSAGVADTDDGVDRLLVRAEEALERARVRESRGAVGS